MRPKCKILLKRKNENIKTMSIIVLVYKTLSKWKNSENKKKTIKIKRKIKSIRINKMQLTPGIHESYCCRL